MDDSAAASGSENPTPPEHRLYSFEEVVLFLDGLGCLPREVNETNSHAFGDWVEHMDSGGEGGDTSVGRPAAAPGEFAPGENPRAVRDAGDGETYVPSAAEQAAALVRWCPRHGERSQDGYGGQPPSCNARVGTVRDGEPHAGWPLLCGLPVYETKAEAEAVAVAAEEGKAIAEGPLSLHVQFEECGSHHPEHGYPCELEAGHGGVHSVTDTITGQAIEWSRSSPPEEYRFVIDGPPSHVAGRFVEVENERGESIEVGDWRSRPNGFWELVVPAPGHEQRDADYKRGWEMHEAMVRDILRGVGGITASDLTQMIADLARIYKGEREGRLRWVTADNQRLTTFLYLLIRDHMAAGKVEELVRRATLVNGPPPRFAATNKHLLSYVHEIIGKLTTDAE